MNEMEKHKKRPLDAVGIVLGSIGIVLFSLILIGAY